MNEPEILDAKSPTTEHKLLIDAFQRMEINQIELLDSSAKRIIELISAFLGLFFAVVAFGDKFPPAYLAGTTAKLISAITLISFLFSLFFAMLALQPRNYKRFKNNVSEMKKEFEKIVSFKTITVQWAGILFFVASTLFAILILYLIITP